MNRRQCVFYLIQIKSLKSAHQMELQNILATHAAEQSTSRVAELHSRVTTQEVSCLLTIQSYCSQGLKSEFNVTLGTPVLKNPVINRVIFYPLILLSIHAIHLSFHLQILPPTHHSILPFIHHFIRQIFHLPNTHSSI